MEVAGRPLGSSWEAGRSALGRLGVAAGAFGYLGLVAVVLADPDSRRWDSFAAPFLVALAGMAVVLSGRWRYRPRALVFVAFIFLGALAHNVTATGPRWQLLYACVSLLAGVTLGPLAALCVALASTAAVLGLSYTSARYPLDAANLALVWLSAGVAWAALGGLFGTVRRAESSEAQAWAYAHGANERRGELVRAKKALGDMYGLLERTNYELAIARNEAEEARHIKAQFAANISHELRTPLNLIMGFSELMYRSPELYGNVRWTPELRFDVHEIYLASRHLLGMIDDILDLSRVDAQRLPLKLEPTDLREVIEEAAATARGLLRGSRVDLNLDVPTQLPSTVVDRTRIRQVLLNLLSNAIRFTDGGQITLSASEGSDELEFTVSDTGVGIPAEELPTIFDEFSQAKTPITSGRGGAGLGLAVCKQFVQLHGGRIWVQSEVGRGSAFRFTIPLPGGRARSRLAYYAPEGWSPPLAGSPPARSVIVFAGSEAAARMVARGIEDYRALPITDLSALRGTVEAEHVAGVVLVRDPLFGGQAPAPEDIWRSVGRRDLGVIEFEVPSESLAREQLDVAAYLIKPVQPRDLLEAVRESRAAADKVLVVDDDSGFRTLMKRVLLAAFPGADIRLCAEPRQALRLLEHESFDLLLLDLVMPGLAGVELLRQARSAGLLAGTKVIVATGAAYEEELSRLLPGRLRFSKMTPAKEQQWFRCIKALLDSAPPDYSRPADGLEPEAVSLVSPS